MVNVNLGKEQIRWYKSTVEKEIPFPLSMNPLTSVTYGVSYIHFEHSSKTKKCNIIQSRTLTCLHQVYIYMSELLVIVIHITPI